MEKLTKEQLKNLEEYIIQLNKEVGLDKETITDVMDGIMTAYLLLNSDK